MSEYFSVRMRASYKSHHISGAERICKLNDLPSIISELLKRPKVFDFLSLKVEKVGHIEYIEPLPIKSFYFKNVEDGKTFAKKLLIDFGIKTDIVDNVFTLISNGPANGKNMRGAMIIDAETGKRLEKDFEKGIRTIKVDWDNREYASTVLSSYKPLKLTNRSLDALALVSKNVKCGILAEVCWSDDKDYTTGYVVVNGVYHRIEPLKQIGSPYGGRAYFIKAKNLESIIRCLREKAFLVIPRVLF